MRGCEGGRTQAGRSPTERAPVIIGDVSTGIDRARVAALMKREERRFVAAHPRSAALFERARHSLLGGVPMNWMSKWPGPFPPFVAEAAGGHFTCVDGHDYVDLCLGDTGAMTGHAPAPAVEAMARQASRGSTMMLPTEDGMSMRFNSSLAA